MQERGENPSNGKGGHGRFGGVTGLRGERELNEQGVAKAKSKSADSGDKS